VRSSYAVDDGSAHHPHRLATREAVPVTDPRFFMAGCLVIYNPPVGMEGFILRSVGDEQQMCGGIVTFRGFDKNSGAVIGNYFRRDESLPPGTMVVYGPDELDKRLKVDPQSADIPSIGTHPASPSEAS
jgi:hypothetical protein